MSITLPTLPTIWEAKPRLVQFNGSLTPTLGGAEQRVQRMGTRFAVDLSFAALSGTLAGNLLGAILKAQSLGSTVITSWPQKTGDAHGAPLVNGGSQAGSVLTIDGLSSRVIRARTFFSFVVSGRNYLHVVTDDVTPVAGAASLAIAPMLRASPADNAVLQFANPQIEGFLSDAASSWTIDMLTSESFTISLQEVQ